jgi:hypothetical protein
MVGGIIPLRRATSSRSDGRLGQESATQIKGIVRSCVIRRPALIPLLRLVILCAEPQVTEFQ